MAASSGFPCYERRAKAGPGCSNSWWLIGALLTLFIAVTPSGQGRISHRAVRFTQVLDLRHQTPGVVHGGAAAPRGPLPVVRRQLLLPTSTGRTTTSGSMLRWSCSWAPTPQAGTIEDVVNLGKALAGAGYAAMFHWSPTMASAGQHRACGNRQPGLGLPVPGRAGVRGPGQGRSGRILRRRVLRAGGRCRPGEYRDHVHFVNAFGPYYDAQDCCLLQAASRSVEYEGEYNSLGYGPADIEVCWPTN